jgi:GT2 family glycosyltransferase
MTVKLSIVVPFFRRLGEFRAVLACNAPTLERPDIEVVLVLDEPTEEPGVLEVVRRYSAIRWRVLVNDEDHEWRAPCIALNVGIRHALGDYVLVVSPESAFVGDVPSEVIAALRHEPGCAVMGQVVFATFLDLQNAGSVGHAFAAHSTAAPLFYGSICAPRSVFRALRGYDESLVHWGGDDVNLRLRMDMYGVPLFTDEDLKLLHLATSSRSARNPEQPRDEAQVARATRPRSPVANDDRTTSWGRAFSRIAKDWVCST